MKLLVEIREGDLGLEKVNVSQYEERIGARAILFYKGKMALLFVGKKKYHKLPGGKAERNESIKDCLMREVFEETGCRIKVIGEVGSIIEYRNKNGIKQTSYCFLAEAVSCSTPTFMEDEIKDEYKLEWVALNEAISMLSKEKSKGYNGKFILRRELAFLEEAKKWKEDI
ncbi:NUDIX domain-containing protein [Candidatus Woesearchaeota archaeon]|nr:NUDIX domain-containing protein [Candidatus Woesearchaeota archaeon]